MELGDLFLKESVTLDDLTKDATGERGAMLNTKSTSAVAASVALSEGNIDLEQFRMLRDSLTTRDGRADYMMREALRKNEEVKKFLEASPELLLSSDLDDDSKRTTLDIVQGKAELKPTSTTEDLITQAYLAESGMYESGEVFESRNLLGDMLGEVARIKQEQQRLVDEFRASRGEPNLVIADLGEIMVPFTEWLQTNQILGEFTEDKPWLMGNQKEAISDFFRNAPLNQRVELTEQLIEYIEENDRVFLQDGNDIMAFHILEQIAVEGDYSNFERWFDNAVSILDVVGVGGAIGASVKGIRSGKAAKVVTRSKVEPGSPSQVVKEVNPELSRAMTKTIDEDPTGEAAQALSGTTREEHLGKEFLPEPEIEAGKVEVKTSYQGPQFPEPEALRRIRTRDGESYLTEAEALRDRERILNSADNVEGFRLQPEETTIRLNDDGSSTFRFLYHPTDAGWKTAAKAIENATYAMRDFGVTADNLKLYSRSIDGQWVETNQQALSARQALREEFTRKKKKIPAELKELDYAVGIDYTHRFDPSSFDEMFDKMPVSRLNFLDRMGFLGIFKDSRGSLTQHLIPPRDLLDSRNVVGPAAAAVDRSVGLKKLMVDEFQEFAEGYAKLNKQDRARMRDYINDANLEGIRFNEGDLQARGFNSEQRQLLKAWRRANDAMYHMANADMARSLRMKGNRVLTDGNENTLIVKPVKRGSVSANTKFYDPTTGDIQTYAGLELTQTFDEFYESGGELVRLASPMEVDGKWIEYAINYNSPSKGYTRAIQDEEIVLSYRDGYYPVMYDANFIIRKKIRTANGDEINKAVGTAKSRQDAEQAVMRLNEEEGEELFSLDLDRRSKTEKAQGILSGEAFEAATSSGLSFQRTRGQRLFDAGNNIHKAGHTNLIDPLEAVARQVHVLAERTALRPYLETMKKRILETYKGKVEFPVINGEVQYPKSASDIKKLPGGSSKDVGDARSMYNYVFQVEQGFRNQIVDDGFKGALNAFADEISKTSKKGEEWLRNFSDQSPSSGLKAAAFKLFLAGNPARQILVQSAQFNQLTAVFPDYILGGGLIKDLHKVNMAKMGISKDKDALKMLKEIEDAGFTVAVDANNLVRAETLRLADLKVTDKLKSAADFPFKKLQEIGFDKGEQFVLTTSWLAHRAKAVKDGKKLTAKTLDQIAGDARAYTWDMNKAGDMPYTGNELNVIFQFLQVPHKASLQPLTNKQLTKQQRLQLLTYNTAMYGIPSVVLPASVITYLTDTFGEDSEVLTVLNDGMIDYMLNGVATQVSGEKQAVDFGDFKPTDMYGLSNMAVGLLTTGIAGLVTESPSGSLLFGANPRITNFAKSVTRWVVPFADYDNPENQTNYKDVAKEAASLMSGYSNAAKAVYAYKSKQKISSLGNITDSDVSDFEAFMQFFGFRTKTEEGNRLAKELYYKDQELNTDDVRAWYNELKRVLVKKGITPQEYEFHQRVMSEVWSAFEPWETKAQESILSFIEADAQRGEFDFIRGLVRNAGGKSTEEVRKMVMQLPVGEIRSDLLKDLDLIDQSIENWSN